MKKKKLIQMEWEICSHIFVDTAHYNEVDILYNLEERTQDCFKQAATHLQEGCRSLLVSNHDKMACKYRTRKA